MEYPFSRALLKKLDLTLGLTANNLWLIWCKAPFDHESTASTGTYYQGFEEANRPGQAASAEELARDNYNTGSFLL